MLYCQQCSRKHEPLWAKAPNNNPHKTSILFSTKQWFEEISTEDLKKDNGLDKVIDFLYKQLGKDDLSDAFEKYEEFEDFKREDGQSISDYIFFQTKGHTYEKVTKLNFQRKF